MKLATLFEGGLVVLALVLGRLLGVDPSEHLVFGATAIEWGVIGTLPMLLLFGLTYNSRLGPLYRIKRLLHETLGPSLATCSWGGLLWLACLAGVSEELLFRGVLQPWFQSLWGTAAGLLVASTLFGLVHFVTPTYAILAGLIGLYLGVSMDFGGQHNLLTPMVIHTLYDFVAFLVVAGAVRKEMALHRPGESGPE